MKFRPLKASFDLCKPLSTVEGHFRPNFDFLNPFPFIFQLLKPILILSRRAKLLLRKKRYQEQLLKNTDSQLDQLERLTHDLEFAQIEIQVVEGLKNGNVALKKMHDAFNIDEIERIMEETKEGVEKQKEIDDLLSGALTQEDEDAVEEEFNELINETVTLPEVPDAEIEDVTPGKELLVFCLFVFRCQLFCREKNEGEEEREGSREGGFRSISFM